VRFPVPPVHTLHFTVPSSMASAVNSDAVCRSNFMKLHNVYYQAASTFLRDVFCEMWKSINGSEWEDDKANGLKLSGLKGLQPI